MSRWLPEIRGVLAEANLDPAREAEIALALEQHLEDRYHELRAAGVDDAGGDPRGTRRTAGGSPHENRARAAAPI